MYFNGISKNGYIISDHMFHVKGRYSRDLKSALFTLWSGQCCNLFTWAQPGSEIPVSIFTADNDTN